MTWASVVRVRMAPSTSSAARTLVDHRAARATLRARAATASSALGGARGAYGTEASSRCARRFCLHANANCSLFRRHSSLAGRVSFGVRRRARRVLLPSATAPGRQPAHARARGFSGSGRARVRHLSRARAVPALGTDIRGHSHPRRRAVDVAARSAPGVWGHDSAGEGVISEPIVFDDGGDVSLLDARCVWVRQVRNSSA